MKQLGIIIVLLLLAGGIYLVATNDSMDTDNNGDDMATTTATSTDTDSTASTTEELSTAFCADLKDNIEGSDDWTIVTGMTDGALIADGDEMTGCVYNVNDSYGGWAPFEGQVGYYEILADDGTSLAQGPMSTVGNWMELGLAGEPIQYTSTLEFDAAGYSEGTLVLHNENAAGLPEMDQTVEIDVVFQ